MFAAKDHVARFDRWSRTYENSWMQRLIFDRVHAEVLAEMGDAAAQTIVDVGCGTGRLLRAIRARRPEARLVGVDAAPGMIDVARSLTPGAEFHIAPAERLPLPDGSADVVLTTISFHHWQDQALGVREAARVLREGGRFILADLKPLLIGRLFGERARSAAERDRMFSAAGLRVSHHRVIGWHRILLSVGVR